MEEIIEGLVMRINFFDQEAFQNNENDDPIFMMTANQN